jgi:nucleoid-associated protein YgaU
MIFQGSRYATATLTPRADAAGVFRATVYPSTIPARASYVSYQVRDGDRFDTIAANALGDAELWWKVAQANPEIGYPDGLVVGQFIRVPVKTS